MEESLKRVSSEKEAEIGELKSQLKDIMFYLDAQSKIAESTNVTKEELEQSQMVIQQGAIASSSSTHQSSESRRRKKK